LPVAANQTSVPVGPVTNTIGAMHGLSRLTWALIVESPAVLAAKSPVLMLVMVALFPAPMLWQLTRARKSGNGVPSDWICSSVYPDPWRQRGMLGWALTQFHSCHRNGGSPGKVGALSLSG
jgi:hypothetical protein